MSGNSSKSTSSFEQRFDLTCAKALLDINEEYFAKITEHTGKIFLKLSIKLNILYYNAVAERIHGWQSLDMTGKNYNEVCKIEQVSVREKIKILNDNNKEFAAEITIRNTLGKIRNLSLYFFYYYNKDGATIIVIGDDITKIKERKSSEQALSYYLEKIFSFLPAAVFWKDKNSMFLGCNEMHATNALLSSPADIIGKTDFDLPWAEAEAYRNDDKEVMETKSPKFNIIETQTNKKSTSKTIITSKVPLIEPSGEVAGIVGFYGDLSNNHFKNLLYLSNRAISDAALSFNSSKDYFLFHENRLISITQREEECMELLSLGQTSKEIAQNLGISQRTVESYINNVKLKTNTTRKSSLIEIFLNNIALNGRIA